MRSISALPLILLAAMGMAPSPGYSAVLDAEGRFAQTWNVYLEVIGSGVPCETAEVEFRLLDERNRRKATTRYPVPEAIGMRHHEWSVNLEDQGDYFLEARISGCRKGGSRKATSPVFITPIGEERFVHLQLLPGREV